MKCVLYSDLKRKLLQEQKITNMETESVLFFLILKKKHLLDNDLPHFNCVFVEFKIRFNEKTEIVSAMLPFIF